MATYAILNESGVLIAYERGSNVEPSGVFVQVDDGCDLDVNKYYWDGAKFIPVPRVGAADEVKQQNVLRAIFLGFRAIETRFPNTLPRETKDWLDQFSKSIDNVKAV